MVKDRNIKRVKDAYGLLGKIDFDKLPSIIQYSVWNAKSRLKTAVKKLQRLEELDEWSLCPKCRTCRKISSSCANSSCSDHVHV